MTMKKIMIVFASALVLAACGTGNSEATVTTDSTVATVDTTLATEVPTEVTNDKDVAEEVK